ncbi:MAG: histone deacetylase, partial [Anaerolineales bacterium]
MKAFYSDTFDFPLPKNHRFPMRKYSRLRERLLDENIVHPDDLLVPPGATDIQLLRAHTKRYLHKVASGTLTEKEIRRIGFPWSPELVERSRRSVGGSLAACQSALKEDMGVNLAGGTHHAHPDWGSGFCVFNDVAVAALDLLENKSTASIVILDCDVHQGDGTADIFAEDPRVYTFSIHGASNFPFRKTVSD